MRFGLCGSVDLTGYPEVQAYYNAVLWGANSKPYIGVRPVDHSGEEYTLGRWRLTDALNSWTWNGCEGRMAEIEVYSIGDSVGVLAVVKSMKESGTIKVTAAAEGMEAVMAEIYSG